MPENEKSPAMRVDIYCIPIYYLYLKSGFGICRYAVITLRPQENMLLQQRLLISDIITLPSIVEA